MSNDPESREQRYERQTKEQYAAIGKFVVKFELVCFYLRSTMSNFLQSSGLKKQELARIVFGHRSMTADALREVYMAMTVELYGDNVVLKDFRSRFQRLTEKRNDIVHGTWFVGWASEDQEDFSAIRGFKDSISKSGSGFKPLPESVEKIAALTREAEELGSLVSRLDGCFRCGFKVSKNFVQENGKWVVPRNAPPLSG